MAGTSFTLVMLGIAGATALVMGVVGIYGVISYTTSQRTREIGIRMAFGAQQKQILGVALGQGASVVLTGIALGLVGSFGLTRVMSSLLFGVSATDPLTFVAVAAILLGVGLVACWIPARRASRIDPMEALRYE